MDEKGPNSYAEYCFAELLVGPQSTKWETGVRTGILRYGSEPTLTRETEALQEAT